MRKHRVFAGILAAVMLLCMAPSALAANTAEYNGPNPGQKNHNGILLDKSAESLDSSMRTTMTLTISAPSDQNPVAVEFVLDGTSSLHGEGDLGLVKTLAEELRSTFAKNENVYVGVTVFGNKAINVLPMTTVPAAIDADLADSVAQMLAETDALFGSNVQSGIRKGLEDLESAALPEGTEKYMVLVTDGGSYSWLSGTESVRNTYTTADGQVHDLMNSDAADGGYASFPSLSALLSKDIPSAAQNLNVTADEPLSEAVLTIKERDDLYTNFETGVYWAAKELETIPSDVNLFTVSRDYYADDEKLSALTELAGEFVDMAVDMDETGLSAQLGGTDLSTAFAKIAGEMNVAVPAGSAIVDYMGKTQTDKGEVVKYNFDLVKDAQITLRVGSNTYMGTLGTGNVINFADGSRLEYTGGADEHFVLTLGSDMARGSKVSVSYVQELVEYDTYSGRHNVLTNVQAYLVPNGSDEGLLFPEPSLSYRIGGDGGGGDGGETIIPDDDVPLADLNETDHYAYIIGGKDGMAHPQNQITRGEVATIYFRMLTDESRNELWSQSNPYTDVQPDTWCNAAVSTMTRAGVIKGFSDGTFRPYAPITRAQFAAIAVRFFEVPYSGADKFSDIENHWAKDYINKAAEAGIINGFSDGTFRPNQNITRAQAMAIFNRVLGRAPHKDHLLPNMTTWPDNMDKNAWYYADVQEATNSHDYEVQTDSEGNDYEVWTTILPVRDWAAFENEWATANSAANPGEVISVPADVVG